MLRSSRSPRRRGRRYERICSCSKSCWSNGDRSALHFGSHSQTRGAMHLLRCNAAFNLALLAEIFKSLDDVRHCFRMNKGRRANLHGAGSGQKIFNCIFSLANASATDDGDINGFVALVNHPQRNWFNRWSRQPAYHVAQAGSKGINIDRHCQNGICYNKSISSACFSRFGNFGNLT